jgi:hypothetical protein
MKRNIVAISALRNFFENTHMEEGEAHVAHVLLNLIEDTHLGQIAERDFRVDRLDEQLAQARETCADLREQLRRESNRTKHTVVISRSQFNSIQAELEAGRKIQAIKNLRNSGGGIVNGLYSAKVIVEKIMDGEYKDWGDEDTQIEVKLP